MRRFTGFEYLKMTDQEQDEILRERATKFAIYYSTLTDEELERILAAAFNNLHNEKIEAAYRKIDNMTLIIIQTEQQARQSKLKESGYDEWERPQASLPPMPR